MKRPNKDALPDPPETKYINIPCSITIEVPWAFDVEDEDALYDEVLEQHGKYPTTEAKYLGYELAEEV